MARIRTVKPDFFRHELLQDLEAANPGAHVMLVFAGLWCQCDKAGRFKWKPRTLKLDILPFLDFDLGASLVLLWEAGLIRKYESDGELYGEVPTFNEHQRISGKEAQDAAKYPEPSSFFECEATGKHNGSNGEALETAGREGKGRERSKSSVPKGTAAEAALDDDEPDPKKVIYDCGKRILGKSSGGQITKAIARIGLSQAFEVLELVRREKPLEPRAYFEKAVATRAANSDQPERPSEGYGCY